MIFVILDIFPPLKLVLHSIRVAGVGAIDHDNSGVSSHLSSQQPQRYKMLHPDEGTAKLYSFVTFDVKDEKIPGLFIRENICFLFYPQDPEQLQERVTTYIH